MHDEFLEGHPVALILGAGDGIGAALAKRFASEGYIACVVRRDSAKLTPLVEEISASGGLAVAFGCDVTNEEDVSGLINMIEMTVGPISVMLYNVGSLSAANVLEESSEGFIEAWQQGCLGAFLCAREVAVSMLERGHGSMIFTGASASLRGSKGFASFAVAKGGLRQLAQSLAHELGPENIHVAHVILDALVQVPSTQERFPAVYQERAALDAMLKPQSIAQNYLQLHQQSRDAWTFELDLRPYCENWG